MYAWRYENAFRNIKATESVILCICIYAIHTRINWTAWGGNVARHLIFIWSRSSKLYFNKVVKHYIHKAHSQYAYRVKSNVKWLFFLNSWFFFCKNAILIDWEFKYILRHRRRKKCFFLHLVINPFPINA